MMNKELLRTCERFIINIDTLRDAFRWDGDMMHLLGGAFLTSYGITPDAGSLTEYERMIKERFPVMSPLRGHLRIALVCNMAGSGNPAEFLDNVERAFSLIRISRGLRDDRFYLAAITMASSIADKEELLTLVDRTNEIYNSMKTGAGIMGNEAGYPAAAVIASSGEEDIEAVIECAGECYEILSEILGEGPSVETLCLMLALDRTGADAAIRCTRLRDMMGSLKEAGVGFSAGYEIAVLGPLSMLDLSNADIAEYVAETDEYLRGQKGFGHLGCGKYMRQMYAALLVTQAYASEIRAVPAAAGTVLENAVRADYAALQTPVMMMAGR